jgi:phospholipid/cholesterol/gamma-HCH transport system ATP-binding protein
VPKMPNPFNRDEGEQAQAEEATQQEVDPSSEPPTTDMSAGDGAEDDRYAFEEAEQREEGGQRDEGGSGAGAAAGAGAGAGAAAAARTSQEAPSGGGNGGPYRSEDGATLGRDFNIPGVDPEDDDPYRWHTGEKRDHGGEDAIEIIDLVKQFGRARILNGLNLGLPDDQISMVLGPSGTGKSVLIKHIVGLLYPDSGDVLVHGESVPNMTDDELFEVRKKFGLLFQDGALFGSMNIFDNVAFPLRQHTDKGEDEISEICERRLREVGLAEAHFKMPNELSGGMRKRAGFARALVLDPAIVMFDELDSGLDPVRTALLCELIREVHEENGGCYMVISHDLGTARRIADFIAVLWKGKIVESGPKEELFNSPNEFVSQFLNADVDGPLAMD